MSKPTLSRYIDPTVLALVADRSFEPRDLIVGNLAGAHKSPLSGLAVEFAGHREYAPGDDPRHIDWRVYFNRDKYFVKQYELETNLVCHIVLDVSASMRYGDADQQKLDYAARLGLTLAFAIVRQHDKVSFTTFDEQVRQHIPPSHSTEQILRISEQMDLTTAVEKTSIRVLSELVGRFGRREIVVIISDFFADPGELEDVVQRLRYDKHEVVLFHILHPDETNLDLDGEATFIGLESDDSLTARLDDVRLAYVEAFSHHAAQIERTAEVNRCEYALTTTDLPLAATLTSYLDRRKR
jgi:uncharacterized protein (DUF58 family)